MGILKHYKKYIVVLFAPVFFIMQTSTALAVHTQPTGTNNLQGLIKIFTNILQPMISVFIALALLYFFWGMSQFILHADSDVEREKGRQVMFWGIIALFVMVSVWGIIRVIQNTFFGYNIL